MKKIIFILTMTLLVCVNANAQMWYIDETQADELKETKASKHALFLTEDGSCLIKGNDFVIAIKTHKGIFDYDGIRNTRHIKVLVGYYVDDNLIDKDIIEFSIKSSPNFATLFQNKKYYYTKIVNHLKTNGDVRFVIERYEDVDFDITLPMNKDLPMYSIE